MFIFYIKPQILGLSTSKVDFRKRRSIVSRLPAKHSISKIGCATFIRQTKN